MTARPRLGLPGPDSVTVTESELAAVTADGADCPALDSLVPVLHQLRNVMGVELIFVGAMRDGVITAHPARPADGAESFEAAYGRMLLEVRCGRTSYASVPVLSDSGMESGTLLCSLPSAGAAAPASLKTVSRLLAARIQAMGPHRVA